MALRRLAWLSCSFALAAACSGTYAGVSPGADAGPSADATTPAPEAGTDGAVQDASKPPPCDLDGPFVTIEPVDDLNTSGDDVGLVITDDGLTAFVVTAESVDGSYGRSLWVSRRTSTTERWPRPERVPGFGVPGMVYDNPTLTGDSRTIFLEMTGPSGGLDIVSFERQKGGPLDVGLARTVVGVSTNAAEFDSYVTRDGKSLYFASDRSGERAVYRASLDGARTATRVNLLLGISINGTEQDPVPSADDKTLYFTRWIAEDGGRSTADIFVAKRADTTTDFEQGVAVPELNTASHEFPVDLSDDGCTLYFTSSLHKPSRGGVDIYAAKKGPARDR